MLLFDKIIINGYEIKFLTYTIQNLINQLKHFFGKEFKLL